jgi:hypothetical protein
MGLAAFCDPRCEIVAQQCVRAQMEQFRFGRIEETLGPEASGAMRLTVTVSGDTVPVVVRKKEEGNGWDIIDGRRQGGVGTLSAEMENPLSSVTGFIQQLVEKK